MIYIFYYLMRSIIELSSDSLPCLSICNRLEMFRQQIVSERERERERPKGGSRFMAIRLVMLA